MVNGDAARAWGARVLAPLAFFFAASVLVLIVYNSLNAETEGSARPTPTTATGAVGGGTAPATTGTAPQQRRFHVIREGDTLESIARRYKTTVDDLLTLNPAIEPNALTPGQRIRVA